MFAEERERRTGLGRDLEIEIGGGESLRHDLGVPQGGVLGPGPAVEVAVPDLDRGVLRKARAANQLKKSLQIERYV